MRATAAAAALILLMVVASAIPARAQAEPPVGVRAAGMAGAFTAVADDASAVFWNPAGLASGAFFSLVLDHNTLDNRSATLIALGTPPLGVSYYRTETDVLANRPNSLVAHHAGVTVLQSLADRVAVGATLKMVRGVVSSAGASISTTKFDTDIGVVTTGSLGRLGLAVRNLTEPEFAAPDGEPVKLERRIRAGAALNIGRRTMAAADFDLTTASTAGGDWREAAVGLETNPIKKAWFRTGIRWNTASGPTAPVGTLGASVAVYGSTMADAHMSFGSEDGDRGWGVGLRFLF
jgi:hypothetical protein